jgi:hypothetical protein
VFVAVLDFASVDLVGQRLGPNVQDSRRWGALGEAVGKAFRDGARVESVAAGRLTAGSPVWRLIGAPPDQGADETTEDDHGDCDPEVTDISR